MKPGTVLFDDYRAFRESVCDERQLPGLDEGLGVAASAELISFIVAVDEPRQLELHIHRSASYQNGRHQWLCIENTDNHRYSDMGRLYNDAMARAAHDLCFFVHQDVFFPPDWEARLYRAIEAVEAADRSWGVVGCAGCVTDRSPVTGRPKRRMLGHWSDPHGLFEPKLPLPARVDVLDEMVLGFRRSHGMSFDAELPGFHHYGADLCMSARAEGRGCYVIDAPVVHKLVASDGRLIRGAEDSPSLRRRSQVKGSPAFVTGAGHVARKWADQLPFYSPCHLFEEPCEGGVA